MRVGSGRVLIAALALCAMLGGCGTSNSLTGMFSQQKPDDPDFPTSAVQQPAATDPNAPIDPAADPASTGTISANGAPPPEVDGGRAGLLGSDPNDDLSLGKKYFRAGSFGIAEQHFRRAVELHPRDAESWVGLAASYDRLRRFDLADRAYKQATAIVGPTPELLNNRGYSYMLRGDYVHARETLLAAAAKDPRNPYIKNNLQLLDKAFRNGKAVQ